ncbi:MAG: hypothetical protein H0V98_08995 [Chloroflexia bacterium]|nr:hypothetical protein [Chloroflexia bacterium]
MSPRRTHADGLADSVGAMGGSFACRWDLVRNGIPWRQFEVLVFVIVVAVKAFVAAVLRILVVFGTTIAPGLEDNIVTVVMFLVPTIGGVWTNRTLRSQATDQAAETREAVYSPATVREERYEAFDQGKLARPPTPVRLDGPAPHSE